MMRKISINGSHWIKEKRILFFLSYGLYMLISLLSTSFYYKYIMGPVFGIMQALCVALLIMDEYIVGKDRQNIRAITLLGILFLIALQVTVGNLTRLVPIMFLYIYSARNIHFASIARFTLYMSSITVMLIVFSGYLGVIDNVVVAKGVRVREYLGFRYALYLPGILLNITALWIYLNKDKVPVSGAILLAGINIFVYLKTDSRISCALALLLLLVGVLMGYMKKVLEKMKWIWLVLSGSFALFGAFSYVSTAIYDSSVGWMRRFNSMLESRLSLGKRSLTTYGVQLFGQRISWVGNGLDAEGNSSNLPYSYVDSLYIKILQRYGILFTALSISLCTCAMNRLRKQKEYLLLIICASVAAHCVLDDLSFSLHYNTFWIALALAILNPSALKWDSRIRS
jgi:hypothetical protein